MLSIVQLSRFLSFSLKRQLWYFIKSVPLCQELFYFPVSLFRFPFGPLQATAYITYHISKALSTVFFICFFSASGSLSSALTSPAVPPPRLRLTWFPAAFQGPVISDRCYLITTRRNCQCFFSFLFISDNSHNYGKYLYIIYLLFHQHLYSPSTGFQTCPDQHFFAEIYMERNSPAR